MCFFCGGGCRNLLNYRLYFIWINIFNVLLNAELQCSNDFRAICCIAIVLFLYLTITCDTLHLPPGQNCRMPSIPVLMIFSFPFASTGGENIQTRPGHSHIPLPGWINRNKILILIRFRCWSSTHLTTGERARPHLLVMRTVQDRTGLLCTLYSQSILLNIKVSINIVHSTVRVSS